MGATPKKVGQHQFDNNSVAYECYKYHSCGSSICHDQLHNGWMGEIFFIPVGDSCTDMALFTKYIFTCLKYAVQTA